MQKKNVNENNNFVVEFYESEWFNELSGGSHHPGGIELVEKVAEYAKIKPGHKVLDIGCGNGSSDLFIAEKYGCSVEGLDSSRKMIDIAKKEAKRREIDKVKFEVLDAGYLPYLESYFDMVLCISSISLFDKKTIFNEVYRVLRSKGRFVITNMVALKKIPDSMKNQLTFASCIAGAETVERFIELFKESGFADIHTEDRSSDLRKQWLKIYVNLLLNKKSSYPNLNKRAKSVNKFLDMAKMISDEEMVGYFLIEGAKR